MTDRRDDERPPTPQPPEARGEALIRRMTASREPVHRESLEPGAPPLNSDDVIDLTRERVQRALPVPPPNPEEARVRAALDARWIGDWRLSELVPESPDEATLLVIAQLVYSLPWWLERLPRELIDAAAHGEGEAGREARREIRRRFRP